MSGTPHVVIVGGGFGGLEAAKTLRRAPVRVTLLDRRNHHLFQPLLYQVATAALSIGDIAHPIRSALRGQKNATVLLAEVRGVDTAGKRVLLDNGDLDYDYLILAAGASHSYFGRDEWEKLAPGLKTVEDALEIRRRVLLAFEAAERESDPARRVEWLTFVVVGAGPTGVELAGALAEVSRHTLARDFRHIDPRAARVVLLEGSERVLPSFPPALSEKAKAQLERLGVDVLCGKLVSAIDDRGVVAGEHLPARTVLWAAGVQAAPLARTLGTELDRAGRVVVEPDLTLPGHPDIYVVGDMALVRSETGPVPGLAPAALQGGRCAARNVLRTIAGEERQPFEYVDKGTLATVGRSKAVGHFRGKVQFSGFIAWVMWWAIHIFFLIGFRNRVAVMFGWVWNYITFQRGARLITGAPLPELPATHAELPAEASGDERGAPERPAARAG